MTGNLAALELPEAHLPVLDLLLKRVPPREYNWALTGSACLRLQGVDIPVHDLDIQTDQKTIPLIERQLGEFIHDPVHAWESTTMRSLDAKGIIQGIEIEILANVTHRQPDGEWCIYTDFSRTIMVETHGLQVPVFPLEDELLACEAMGRFEKAALIRQAIQKAGR